MGSNGYVLVDPKYYEYLKAADQGDAAAYFRLHQHYALGLGLYSVGEMWLKAAAERGDSAGMYSYGVGLWNKASNQSEREAATAWIRRAALAGHENAKKLLQEEAKQ